jgi:hypothetical protein
VSLGSGHVWRTEGVASSTCVDWIVCTGCGASRMGPTVKLKRRYRTPKRGKNYSFSSARLHGGRPLGTCPEVARRRAAGEAEVRATFDLFE